MDALTAENVTSGYGRSPIVHDVSISVATGFVTAIVGPNGAGKSTFAKTLAGILRPMSGRIVVNGTDITRVPGHLIPRYGLGYVPQNDNVFRTMSVRENLEVGGFASKKDPAARMKEVYGIFPDLKKAEGKKAGNLSGGQQNLLAMARVLMAEPTVIVLDEPTAGLSPAYTDIVWRQVELIAREGTAVLVIEQNVERALSHAQFVHVLVAGTNHVHGPVSEIARLDLAGIFLGRDQSMDTRLSAAAIEAVEPVAPDAQLPI
jgi:ABC-type branched-subunit amino acid transport system ATPase component